MRADPPAFDKEGCASTARGAGGSSGAVEAQPFRGKVYDYHTGACMIFIQSARQSLGKLGRTLIILYFRLTIKHTNPPIT